MKEIMLYVIYIFVLCLEMNFDYKVKAKFLTNPIVSLIIDMGYIIMMLSVIFFIYFVVSYIYKDINNLSLPPV